MKFSTTPSTNSRLTTSGLLIRSTVSRRDARWNLYIGAAGTIWALHHLSPKPDSLPDFSIVVPPRLLEPNRSWILNVKGAGQDLLYPRALEKEVDQPHCGSRFSGAGCHDQQGAALAGLEGLRHAPDRLMLIGAFANELIDGRVFKLLLIFADKAETEQIVEGEKARNRTRMRETDLPIENGAGHLS